MATRTAKKPDQTVAQAITRAMNGGAPLTAAELAKMTPAERKGAEAIVKQTNAAIKAGKAQAVTDPKLTGVKAPTKTPAKKDATPAPKKQPAAAPAAKAKPDVITSVKGTASGPDHIIVVAGDKNVAIPRTKFVGQLAKVAVVGGSLRAVQDYIATHKMPAKLATGLDGRTAPQSAMAAADSNRAKPSPTSVKPGAGEKWANRKAKPASNNAKLGDGQKITVVAKGNPYKAGTKAAATFDLFAKAGTVGGFKALVAKAPQNYDGGYIRYSSRDGYIKIG